MLLITGANGQLGQELAALLPEALFTDAAELDITDKQAVDDYVRTQGVKTIINCAAYTAVDKAEEDEAVAERVNVLGPKNLAQSGVQIIHISTDYVFDGTAHLPYTEADKPHPMSVYGKSKLAGEKAVLENAKTAIIIRTAWLYSAHGNNFVKTMRRLGAERLSLNVVADQIGSPTNAADLAQAIVDIVPQIKEGTKEVYHYTNEGVASWYDFAVEIMALSGLSCKVCPIESKDYPTKAARPFYSVLNKSKIKQDFGISIPHWKESLEKCLKQF